MSIENEEELERLMFDPDLKKTRIYFKVLQVLRIFSVIIEAAEVAFESFSRDHHHGRFYGSHGQPLEEENLIIDHNWTTLKELHREKAKKLLFEISTMRKEIESLRDGVGQPYHLERIVLT